MGKILKSVHIYDSLTVNGSTNIAFTKLFDTPSTYVDQLNKLVVVNNEGTGLVFIDASTLDFYNKLLIDASYAYLDASIRNLSTGGGHIIEQDGVSSTQEDTLNIITNGERTVVSNDAGVATDLELQFEANIDVDPTGMTADNIWGRNSANTKTVPIASAPYDGVLPPSPEAGLSGADETHILIDTLWLAGHTLGAWITNETANVITGVKLTDGTNDLTTAVNLAATIGDAKYVTFDMQYADQLNDISIYIYATTWNSGTVTFKQSQRKF